MPWLSGGTRCGSQTTSAAPSRASIPPPTPSRHDQVGNGPNGIAVTPGAVWVSNELAGTLSRIDPVRNKTVQTVTIGNRPQGIVLDSGALYVAVRASGAGHRGGTLKVLTTAPYLANLDPALAYLPFELQMVVPHERRAYGPAEGGRQRRPPSGDRSRRLACRPDQRRPGLQLPATPGHPLLERGARAAAGLPPRDRALARPGRRHSRSTTPASSGRAGASPPRTSRATSRGGS